MPAVSEQSYRNFELIRGNGRASSSRLQFRGRRKGRRTKTAAEIVLGRWVREEFNALVDPDGNRPSDAIQKICEGVQLPLAYFGRRLVEAHAAHCTHAQAKQLWARVGLWIDRLWEQPKDAEDVVRETIFYQSPRAA